MKVDIVMNVYNAEKIIEHFLNSLSEQTFKDFHLIVVDQLIQQLKKLKNIKVNLIWFYISSLIRD